MFKEHIGPYGAIQFLSDIPGNRDIDRRERSAARRLWKLYFAREEQQGGARDGAEARTR